MKIPLGSETMNRIEETRRDELLRRLIEGDITAEERIELRRMRDEDPRFDLEAQRLIEQDAILARVPEVETPADLAASIMKQVHEAEPPNRLYAFLFRPRTLKYRLATGLTAAAAVAAAVLLVVWSLDDPGKGEDGANLAAYDDRSGSMDQDSADGSGQTRTTRDLVIEMAVGSASRVRLVGDFNGWREEGLELTDADGDGVWTLRLDVEPGRYGYRILVDEDRWLTDPAADAQVNDGFGGIDSVRHVL
jgi:hypothetical protein